MPRRRWWLAAAALLVLLGLLVAADRITAAKTEATIASRVQRYGLTGQPDVTVEGFPFLTQLLGGHLDGVVITGGRLRLGTVTAAAQVQADGITLGGRDYVIARLTGTGLIPFSGVDQLMRGAGVPGAKVSAAGPRLLRVQVTVSFFTATATASIAAQPPASLAVRLVSAPGIPSFLLDRFRSFTIGLPQLPAGVTVRGVRVVRQGVVIAVTGHGVHVPA